MCDIVNSVNYKGKSLLDSFVLIQFILYMLPTKASFSGPSNEGPECLLSSFGVQVSVSSLEEAEDEGELLRVVGVGGDNSGS